VRGVHKPVTDFRAKQESDLAKPVPEAQFRTSRREESLSDDRGNSLPQCENLALAVDSKGFGVRQWAGISGQKSSGDFDLLV
jgi:hypothetical protein